MGEAPLTVAEQEVGEPTATDEGENVTVVVVDGRTEPERVQSRVVPKAEDREQDWIFSGTRRLG